MTTTGEGLTWPAIWRHWDLIENDMQDRGVDLSAAVVDPATQRWEPLLDIRTGRWMRVRVIGLLSADTRLHRRLTAKPERSADDAST